MQEGSEDWDDLTTWVSQGVEANDPEVYSPEGLSVVRRVLQGYQARGENDRGLSVCKFLIQHATEPAVVQEMTDQEQLFQSHASVDISVSMDCSDSIVSYKHVTEIRTPLQTEKHPSRSKPLVDTPLEEDSKSPLDRHVPQKAEASRIASSPPPDQDTPDSGSHSQ